MVGYNGLFRNVETQLDARIVKEATALRDEVNRKVFIETSVLLGLLLLAILFAWLVARSMARSLRELRQGALSVAQFGLPHAVNRLRDPTLHQSLTPAQVADQVAEPLPVRSRDEFGQVTEAFNAVHLEAVRTAAEQAALRSSVATMFVNLARRSQILVDRLIGHLDRLERGEEDPDRLAELFQLDHLATRMRRNDENLLVLAGADSTRVQREPAALIDVLRAAQSEVEHYTRIEFGMIDRDIEVAAHAVNDMVHLVAELFDNATAFSPPNSTVLVEARHVGDGAILSVEDRGIGIRNHQHIAALD
jgi:signal transduction histidine kinase